MNLHTTSSYTNFEKDFLLIERLSDSHELRFITSIGADFGVSARPRNCFSAKFGICVTSAQIFTLFVWFFSTFIRSLTSPWAHVCGGHSHDRRRSQYACTQSHKMILMKIIIEYSRDETLHSMHKIRQNRKKIHEYNNNKQLVQPIT